MTAFQGAVDAPFTAFGIDGVYTPAGCDPVPARVIARRPDAIVGFGETLTERGTMPVADGPGLGVALDPDRLAAAATLQLLFALPNADYFECNQDPNALRDEIMRGTLFGLDDGMVVPNERPGLGPGIDEAALERWRVRS